MQVIECKCCFFLFRIKFHQVVLCTSTIQRLREAASLIFWWLWKCSKLLPRAFDLIWNVLFVGLWDEKDFFSIRNHQRASSTLASASSTSTVEMTSFRGLFWLQVRFPDIARKKIHFQLYPSHWLIFRLPILILMRLLFSSSGSEYDWLASV